MSKADLNIRGAGSVLGESQSGNYEVVGYDLYCKMLNDAVRELRGEKVFHEYETEIDLLRRMVRSMYSSMMVRDHA